MSRLTPTTQLLFLLTETALQLASAAYYFHTTSYFTAFCCFIFLPTLIVNLISLIWVFRTMDFGHKQCGRILCACLHVFQLGTLWRYFKLMIAFEIGDCDEFVLLRLVQVALQNAPYIVVQSYLILKNEDYPGYALASAIIALLSLALSMVLYFESGKNNKEKNQVRSQNSKEQKLYIRLLALILRFIWRVLTLFSRFIALTLFSCTLHYWTLLFVGTHWLCLLIWIEIQQLLTSKAPPKHWKTRIMDWFLAYVQVFDILDSKTYHKVYKIIAFYFVILVENILMTVIWYTEENNTANYKVTAMILMLTTLAIGIVCLAVNYVCFYKQKSRNLTQKPRWAWNKQNGASNNIEIAVDEMHWDAYDTDIIQQSTHCYENTAFELQAPMKLPGSVLQTEKDDTDNLQNLAGGNSKFIPEQKVEFLEIKPQRKLPAIPNSEVTQDNNKRPTKRTKSRRQLPFIPNLDEDEVPRRRQLQPSLNTKDVSRTKQMELSISTEQGSSNSRNTNTIDISAPSGSMVADLKANTNQKTKNGTNVTTKPSKTLPSLPAPKQNVPSKTKQRKQLPWLFDFEAVISETTSFLSDLESHNIYDKHQHKVPSHCETCGETLTSYYSDYTSTDTDLSEFTGFSWSIHNVCTTGGLTHLPKEDTKLTPFDTIREWLETNAKYHQKQPLRHRTEGRRAARLDNALASPMGSSNQMKLSVYSLPKDSYHKSSTENISNASLINSQMNNNKRKGKSEMTNKVPKESMQHLNHSHTNVLVEQPKPEIGFNVKKVREKTPIPSISVSVPFYKASTEMEHHLRSPSQTADKQANKTSTSTIRDLPRSESRQSKNSTMVNIGSPAGSSLILASSPQDITQESDKIKSPKQKKVRNLPDISNLQNATSKGKNTQSTKSPTRSKNPTSYEDAIAERKKLASPELEVTAAPKKRGTPEDIVSSNVRSRSSKFSDGTKMENTTPRKSRTSKSKTMSTVNMKQIDEQDIEFEKPGDQRKSLAIPDLAFPANVETETKTKSKERKIRKQKISYTSASDIEPAAGSVKDSPAEVHVENGIINKTTQNVDHANDDNDIGKTQPSIPPKRKKKIPKETSNKSAKTLPDDSYITHDGTDSDNKILNISPARKTRKLPSPEKTIQSQSHTETNMDSTDTKHANTPEIASKQVSTAKQKALKQMRKTSKYVPQNIHSTSHAFLRFSSLRADIGSPKEGASNESFSRSGRRSLPRTPIHRRIVSQESMV